jgi:hypothetical protein
MTEDHHINQLSGHLGADLHQGANSFNILDINRAQVAFAVERLWEESQLEEKHLQNSRQPKGQMAILC